MVSHNSHRLDLFFFILFSFLFWLDGFKCPVFKITNFCFWVISLCWCSLLHFFISFIIFFSSRISIFFFFVNSVSQLYFLFCSCIVFLISLSGLSMFSCLLGFLKNTYFEFFQQFVYFHFLGVSYWKITVFLWWCYVYLIFHVSCSLDWCLHIFWSNYPFQIYQLVHLQVGARVADRWVWWFRTWGRPMVQSRCTEVSAGKDCRSLQQPMLLISVAAVKAARVFSGGGCWSFFPWGMSWPRGFLLILGLAYGCPHGGSGGAVV